MRRAAQEYLHETATAAAVVLRGEERVSLQATVLFLFLAHLCSISCTQHFFDIKAPFLTSACIV